jgi:hypothetical protein
LPCQQLNGMHQDQEGTFEQKMKQDAPAKTLEQRKQN